MFFSDREVESQSISTILKNGIQLEDVLADMAAETKSSNVVVEKTASQQYIDMKVRLQEVETFRPIIGKKIAPKLNPLLTQIASNVVPVQKSWSFSSNSKKSKVASSSSKKKGIKQQKGADYQDKLSMKMAAKFQKSKNRKG